MADIAEVAEVLSQAGVIDRLKEDAQAEREKEREGLLGKLEAVEKRRIELAEGAAKETSGKAAEVARLEAELAKARVGLNQANEELTGLDATATKLRGKLRRLADPRIDAAILKLSDYSEMARQRFISGEVPVYGIIRRRTTKTVNNAETVAEIMAACRAGQAQLEALQESARPHHLEETIKAIVDPIKIRLRDLAGLR